MQANRTTWLRRVGGLAVCLLLFLPMNSCSAVTGLFTGAVTGSYDITRTMVDEGVDDPDHLTAVIVLGPVGVILGPVLGFFKGLALDYTCLTTEEVSYGDIYGSMGKASVWRPFAWNWMEPK
jgi:hypothetical protein